MRRAVKSAVALAAVGVFGISGTAVATPAAGSRSGSGPTISATCDGSGGAGGRGAGFGRHRAAKKAAPKVQMPAAVPGATISKDVTKMLTLLVQDEKLARDVYNLAAAKYPDRVFSNIAGSEATHLAAVRRLLKRYGVADPTAGGKAGAFPDRDVQGLYDQLAAQVRSGRDAAVQAGIVVEKADIADLQKLLAMTAPADVKTVMGSLLAASERHLAAFQRNA